VYLAQVLVEFVALRVAPLGWIVVALLAEGQAAAGEVGRGVVVVDARGHDVLMLHALHVP
jgi:hypothetical protein